MKYLLNYGKINNWKISEIQKNMEDIEGLPLSKCKISKLVFYNDIPILTGNGVYIFFKNKNKNNKIYLYVGKCSSRNFVERIPAHFNVKNTGWFNSYLRNLVNKKRKENDEPKIKVKEFKDPETEDKKEEYNKLLKEQAKIALENHKLILINFEPDFSNKENKSKKKEKIKKISTLEKLLNRILIKKVNTIDKTKTVAEYIGEV